MSKINILSIIFLLAAINLSAQTYSGGNGTKDSPYLISSKADMEALANAVNGGTNVYEGKYFRLTQSLTGSSNALTTSVGKLDVSSFRGVFDGNGYEIELNNTQGVFGYLVDATIQNLGIKGTVSSSGNYPYAGGICAYANYSTIAYCYNSATVSATAATEFNGETRAGGICGYAYRTTITNCYNTGAISSNSSSNNYWCWSGGICGYLYAGNILNCYNTGNISAVCPTNNGAAGAGGICGNADDSGINKASIKNCFAANSSIQAKRDDGRATGYAGRIIYYTGNTTEYSNNYALSTMTVNGSTVSSSDAASRDGAGTSLSNFKSQSWIQNSLKWDFSVIWQMSASSSANQGFPVFRNTDKPVYYTITAKSGNNGSISPSGDASIRQGESITYTFTPNSGFQISQVVIDNNNYNPDAVTSGSYTFTDVTRNHTIEVIFRPVSPPTFSGGQGTKSSPYLISSKADMVALANAVEGGERYMDKFFRLTQNLTGADAVSTSVGAYSGYSDRNCFSGVFDGGGYEIELNSAERGVFGNLYYAIVQNLGVRGTVTTPAAPTDYAYTGGISAFAYYSKIYNCHNAATVSTKGLNSNAYRIGGICGYAGYSEILYCYNTGSISSTIALLSSCYGGGIAGYTSYTIVSNCFNSGSISGLRNINGFEFGGIIAEVSYGSITNCYNSGNISVQSNGWGYAGGICGYDIYAEITNCFSANASIDFKNDENWNLGSIGRIAGGNSNNTKRSNNYALSTMTLNGSTVSSSDATDINGAGTSLSNFKSQSWIASNLKWDFSTVWQMSASSSSFQGLPILRSETKTIYFTITATSTNNGSISPSGQSSVGLGESKTYTITPNPGFQIYQVVVDDNYNSDAVSSGTYTFTNVARNHTIAVFFRPVTPPAFSGGSGTVSSPYLISSKADMEALAAAVEGGMNYGGGKYFCLTQNLTGTNAVSISIGIPRSPDKAFGGIFDGRGYEIELNNAPAGVFGYIYYATIQNLGVTGKVSSSSSNADSYTGGICGYSEYSTIIYCYNAATVSAVAGTVYIGGICGRASRTKITDCFNRGAISSFSNYNCYSGGICGYSGSNDSILNCYNTGNVSAVSQTNYSVSAGGICGEGRATTNCFSANASIEAKYSGGSQNDSYIGRIAGYLYNAEFNKNYALSTMSLNGSTVSSSDVTSRNGAGTSLSNFKSQSWIQNNLGWDFDAVWKMSSSSSVNQGFPVFKQYTITAAAGEGGSISPNGTVSVPHGSDQTFTFTPNTGYVIDEVLVDGAGNASAKTNGSYTFSNVTDNHTISVTFKLKTYTITASASAGGSLSPSGNISVNHGSDQTFTFTPNTGYLIDDVLIDGAGDASAIASGLWTFQNVTENHTISVSFKPECLSDVVIQVWDDVLSVVNNPANNGGYTFSTYQWYKNGTAIQGETSGNLYLAGDAGRTAAQYTCRVTTSGSQTLETCPVRFTSSVLKAYPNPTAGKVILENVDLKAGDKIEVFGPTGTLAKQFTAQPLQTGIDLGGLPKGIYMIKVNNKQVKIILL